MTVLCGILLGLTSCFTGIESTKKINLSREDRKLSKASAEEKFMDSVSTFPLKEWNDGKKFIVADDKALLVIVPQEGRLPTPPDALKGSILSFAGVDSKINAAGQIILVALFADENYLYAYDTGKTFDEAMENLLSDQIPMLIDMDMIQEARNLLKGKSFWSRTNLWYDKDGNRIDGRKFVEVTVTDVMPGDMVFPLWLQIQDDNNETAYLFMNFGHADNESRAFHNLFSLSDIKKHYPNIDQDTWKLISRGQVAAGMTKEECRLALGNPKEINSGHDYSQTLDIWHYDNGIVLWFEDGRLVKIRQ